jgi:hypothetical protein
MALFPMTTPTLPGMDLPLSQAIALGGAGIGIAYEDVIGRVTWEDAAKVAGFVGTVVAAPIVVPALASAGSTIGGASVGLWDQIKGAAGGLWDEVVDVAKEQGSAIITNAVNDITTRARGAQTAVSVANQGANTAAALQSAFTNPVVIAMAAGVGVVLLLRD